MSNGAGTAPDPRRMGAGIELDRAMATQVMGWRDYDALCNAVVDDDEAFEHACENPPACPYVEHDEAWTDDIDNVGLCVVRSQEDGHEYWQPSLSLDTAREVEERIAELGLEHQYTLALIDLVIPGGQHAHYALSGVWSLITASAEDRCRAALWVVRERT